LARIHLAGGDTVAEENAGEAFCQHHLAAGRAQGDGRVLARTAAAEVAPADDDGIVAVERAGPDKPGRIRRVRQTAQRETAELLVFLGDGRDKIEKLGGDDLVRV